MVGGWPHSYLWRTMAGAGCGANPVIRNTH